MPHSTPLHRPSLCSLGRRWAARSGLRKAAAGALICFLSLTPPALAQAPAQARLTLRALLDAVVARHPLIDASGSSLRAAYGSRRTAGALGNPVLSYQVENAPLPSRAAPPMDRETMAVAMLPLESFYQRAPRVRRADAHIRASEAALAAVRRRLVLDASSAFYQTALAQVRVAVTSDMLQWLDSLVAYNRTRAEEGLAAEADVLRSELERGRVMAQGSLEEVGLVRARALLSTFLAAPAAASLVVVIDSLPLTNPVHGAGLLDVPSPARANLADTTRARAIAQALNQRPEMRMAREQIAAAEAGVSAERSMVVRQLSAMLGTKRSAGSTSLIAGVSIPFPFFDQNRGEVARAAAERDAAGFELASREREVRAEVDAAYEGARILTQRLTALVAGESTARQRPAPGTIAYLLRADESRRIALGAFREGAIPLLLVLDAARARGEARIAFFEALYAQHETVLELLAAEGRDVAALLAAAARSGAPAGSPSTESPGHGTK